MTHSYSPIDRMPGHLIRRLQQLSNQVFTQQLEAAGYDLTSVQFAALHTIHGQPGIDQAGVASAIAYDRVTIGGVIDRLEQKQWITRSVNPEDRRARTLHLTTKGKNALHKIFPVVQSLQPDILDGLNRQERQQFIQLAYKVIFHEPRT